MPDLSLTDWPVSLIVSILTGLALVIVVGTWWRLGSTRAGVGQPLVWSYAAAGVAAAIAWGLFVYFDEDDLLGGSLFGVFALGLWWLAGVLTIFIMIRLVTVGRHHHPGRHADASGRTPGRLARWLGTLAHLTLILIVLVFTFAYVTKLV